jgi:ADP-ribose pyrophosphatase YjhB (NUDIX family)
MPPTLDLARKLLALAQSGLHFTRDAYDKERYEEISRIASELLAAESAAVPGATSEVILDLWRQDKGYVTPKIEVRGAIFRENGGISEILLVRETIDGKWTLPGGWVDVNEGPRQAIEKEIVQESGYIAEVVKLAAVYDKLRHDHPPSLFHTWKLFFLCEIRGGQPTLSLETDGIEFFALDSLPELSMSRTTPAQIARMHVHYCNRDLPTDVD